MRVFIFILLLLNLAIAKDGIWVKVYNSKPIYKEIKKVIPKRVCREYERNHKHKIVKRCKNYDRVVYKKVFYGYENSIKIKSNGKKYKFEFLTDNRVFQVKLGVLDYR